MSLQIRRDLYHVQKAEAAELRRIGTDTKRPAGVSRRAGFGFATARAVRAF